jgi:hypothetical protein
MTYKPQNQTVILSQQEIKLLTAGLNNLLNNISNKLPDEPLAIEDLAEIAPEQQLKYLTNVMMAKDASELFGRLVNLLPDELAEQIKEAAGWE